MDKYTGLVPAAPAVGDPVRASFGDAVTQQIAALGLRIGARATTNVAQAMTAGGVAVANNGGAAAWTATEDSGGFVSATAGSTAPIVIPPNKDGLYVVGIGIRLSTLTTTRGFAQLLVNGGTAGATTAQVTVTGNQVGEASWVLSLAAGTTLGFESVSSVANSLSVNSQIYCYRIGN